MQPGFSSADATLASPYGPGRITHAAWVLPALLALAGACRSSSPGVVSVCGFEDSPEGCFDSCLQASTCDAGFFCSEDRLCDAECSDAVARFACGDGFVCGNDGRCRTRPPDPRLCETPTLASTPQTPTVDLLVDQSGSMRLPFGGVSRWRAVQDLIGGTDGVIERFGTRIHFGLTLYSARSIDSGPNQGKPDGRCPLLSQVPAAIANSALMRETLLNAEPIDDTPTPDALRALRAQMLQRGPIGSGPQSIVLATDGEPDSCANLDPADNAAAREATLAAVQAAYTSGIRTFVLFVGSPDSTQHLNELAYAGLGLPLPGREDEPRFLAAETSSELDRLFTQLLEGIVACEVELAAPVAPVGACLGEVLLNGEPLVCGDANGWEPAGTSRIRLRGSACSALSDESRDVRARFPCDAPGGLI